MLVAGCVSAAPEAITDQQRRFEEIVALPAPDRDGTMSVEATLAERRSRRTFSTAELPIDVVGQLLWAGQGVTADSGYRTAPSAGATYPLELYATTATNVMHYLPEDHRLERRPDRTALAALATLAFGQDVVGAAPFVIVVVGVPSRTEAEYGAFGAAFVDREAGHATQNILLQATALGLAAVPVGGFDPVGVADSSRSRPATRCSTSSRSAPRPDRWYAHLGPSLRTPALRLRLRPSGSALPAPAVRLRPSGSRLPALRLRHARRFGA